MKEKCLTARDIRRNYYKCTYRHVCVEMYLKIRPQEIESVIEKRNRKGRENDTEKCKETDGQLK